MKLDDDYEEYEDWDQEDGEEEDREEPGMAVKPMTKALVFLGLVAAAAIICAVLWNVTHKGNPGDSSPGDSSSGEQTGENLQTGESLSGEDSGMMPEESQESEPETVPESVPEESPASGPGTDPEEGSEPGSGTVLGTDGASGETPETSDLNAADDDGAGEITGAAAMAFTECQDTVTPKELINLRSAPTTGQADNVVAQAANGELLTRTGINSDAGWSRLEYNGQTLYAVSRYLTEDLTYQPPVAEPDPNVVSTKDGRTITFTDCDDNISPKEYVNLRLEPSTSEGNDTVHCRLEYGKIVHRTGISEASGWSRVEYDGMVLYVVTSYMYVVEEQ